LKWQAAATGGWTLLSTTTLSGTTVTLNVSSGYKKIVLWVTDWYTNTGGLYSIFRINGNGSDYTTVYPEGNITDNAITYAGYFAPNSGQIEVYPSPSNSANNDAVIVLEFDAPDETNMHKTFRGLSRYTNNNNKSMFYTISGVWRNSSAITSLVMTSGGGGTSWSGGTAYLYGVK
jgi:hypothetical protein